MCDSKNFSKNYFFVSFLGGVLAFSSFSDSEDEDDSDSPVELSFGLFGFKGRFFFATGDLNFLTFSKCTWRIN